MTEKAGSISMKVKQSDIARQLNISTTAVSLAINNKPGVSEDTRRQVIDICRDIGYELPAVEKISQICGSIGLYIYKKHGLVVSDTSFFSQVLEGIAMEAARRDIDLKYVYLSEKVNSREKMRDMLQSTDSDGIIVLATEMDKEDLKLLDYVNVPFVILDAYFEYAKMDTVLIDNIEATKKIVEYLLSCGHVKIGYLKSRIRIKNFRERESGLKQTMQKHNIKYDTKYEFKIGSTPETAYQDFFELLGQGRELPTAFFADNDIIAMGAMRALKDHNIRVPQDVSIVGFDGVPDSSVISPPLTTVRVRGRDLGNLAVSRLVDKIQNDSLIYVTSRLGTELIAGGSVCRPQKSQEAKR